MEEEKLDVNVNNNNSNNKPENKSKTLVIVIVVVVIVLLFVGTFYFLSKIENKEGDKEKAPINSNQNYENWNGVYKNNSSNAQILLFTKDGKIGTMKVANELMIEEKMELIHSINYEDAMTFKDGKMLKLEDDKVIFTIELKGDEITIKYSGDAEQKDGYLSIIGTFKRVKKVNNSNIEEFIKQ